MRIAVLLAGFGAVATIQAAPSFFGPTLYLAKADVPARLRGRKSSGPQRFQGWNSWSRYSGLSNEYPEEHPMSRRVFLPITILLVMICVHLPGNMACAGVLLFETADGTQQTSGVLFGDDSYLLHRFEVTAPTQLESVGGYFQSFNAGTARIFGAIVALSGPSDVPNSNDLLAGDLLGSTFIDITETGINGQDFSGALNPPLAVGWYALVFGTDAFGAPPGPAFDLSMPSHSNDLAPTQDPVSLFQPDHPTLANQIIIQLAEPRFFATAVPEPTTYSLAIIAAVLLGCIRLRRAVA